MPETSHLSSTSPAFRIRICGLGAHSDPFFISSERNNDPVAPSNPTVEDHPVCAVRQHVPAGDAAGLNCGTQRYAKLRWASPKMRLAVIRSLSQRFQAGA